MDCCKRKYKSARCSGVVLSKLLAARKFFYLCSCSQKNLSTRMLTNARKDHSSPLQ